jgi:ubiquinol-cytochrome c reductase cytochrome b subunit
MKALLCWFNDRTGFCDWCSRLSRSPLPGRACCCKTLPCVVVFLFCVQAITGFCLWVYYSPSAQTAWESVYYLQNDVAGGWLLRAIHHYTAHVLLAVLILAVVGSILRRTCRPPRELVFWATVGLGLFALAAILTGDLLSWDQNGYAATKTRTGFLALLPWVGNDLLKIAIGGPGPALGSLSLTRFLALHIGAFGGGFLVLLIIRSILARRAAEAQLAKSGTGKKESLGGRASTTDELPPTATASVPYWPAQAWRGSVACLLVFGIVMLLVCQHGTTPPSAGAPLLSPADTNPLNAYDAARPEWFLVGVYEFSHLFAGQWALIPIFIVPGLLVCIALAMPFFARHWLGYAFNVLFTVLLLVAIVGMTCYSYAKDAAAADHQRAIAVERWQAGRVCELIRHNDGIPPAGALSLLRKDAKTEGRRLFVQHCASCHNHATKDGNNPIVDIALDKPTAPNLAGFASREWIAGLLDPKRIKGPDYFGGTKLRSGEMAGFVKDTIAELDADKKKDLKTAIMVLSAEAKLPSQKSADAQDAAAIAKGHKLIDDFGCTGCHKFHKDGSLGSAPDLTTYGSAAWIEGIIRNAAHRRFYGKLNDRMPAYGGSADPSQDTLSPEQIRLVAEWLRGEWWEPGAK